MNTQTITSSAQPRPETSSFDSDTQQLWLASGLLLITGIVPALFGNAYWEHSFQLMNIYIAVTVLQNWLFVDAGQKSFGQGVLLGLGAYGLAVASGVFDQPIAVGLFWGIVASAAGGLLFALPALRVQGFHLGFVTLSAAVVFPQLLLQMDDLTQGLNGISMPMRGLSEPLLLGVSTLSLLCTAAPIIALLFHYKMRRSRLGRRMRTAAESPEAARSLGIRPGVMSSLAFLIASVGTGICGLLFVPAVSFVTPQSFLMDVSFIFFFAVVVGGRGQLLGPVVGIWAVFTIPNILLVDLAHYKPLVYGFITLFVVILFPDGIVGTIEEFRQKKRKAGGGERAFHLTALTDWLSALPDHKAAAEDEPILTVRGATKRFGSVVAVDRVDFDLRPGEVHGLIGANGSGKTSLLNILNGFSRMNEGSYHFAGRDVSKATAPAIAERGLGRTFQTPRVFPSFSVWNNVRVGLDARETEMPAGLEQILREMEAEHADGMPTLLSHGQRRILEVVRVVLKDSPVVLFDEPAAGLSGEEREEFSKLVKLLSRKLGTAVVLVEHDLELVWSIADRITVLETGSVIASGRPADLVRDPAVQHLFVGGAHVDA
ncbi:ABC transporter permease subunit [Thalassorhabdomicrobium marinisediminis]|uniref:ABC transporter n=1 Tax=Thalassorhabdomicrobium marinisediminis TaxID=2170577 RepID=A0A2T7FU78_9RHOB|nr:ATP-binding cassette domain-containing protein [Thalassorhabdomicrobium marinisediminis]PVA05724.1 ABC transporter [Thalassorhabdomicrobium marinisediminis]